ncbi:MAG: filamentous hemagglutinin N-terminal domain-containing protein [Scytonema sp. PMC 1069.18]|nr:filamentous hemagglutinin N-terminal domain-containing protein [Scytonema sp. PMC 1069.18]MEC4881508.1 filamentous hemagglutinin N-terminal domain-containing protein [Scytonema sp. PMC 1070.18]
MLSTNGWNWSWGRFLGLGIGIVSGGFSSTDCVIAQITSDGTLPNPSIVNLEGKIWNINGGTQQGGNLFHSFKDFSVNAGEQAHFNNAAAIQNIISRVTGLSISNIDGLIKVAGNANLFLINPQGIVFGQNASLDLRGSFIATTADSLKFADGKEFSAKNPQTTPLLTMSVPTGLQFGSRAGSITVRGNLEVPTGKTLALVGGNVNLQTGNLKAEEGRIELGSVAEAGLVSLTPLTQNNLDQGYAFGYADVANFGEIEMKGSVIDANSNNNGGTIQIQGGNVSLGDAAKIQADTLGASQIGGTVFIQASQLNVGGGSEITTDTNGQGQGGSVTINAPDLVKLDGNGTIVSAITTGNKPAGYVKINAGQLVVQDGARIRTITAGNGAAGYVKIDTNKLVVQNGGLIWTGTTRGNGRAGDITVNASDSVELISNSSSRSITGLYLRSQSVNGDAGNVTINTGKLIVQDGARIDTSTAANGKAGHLTIVASDSVIVSGANPANASLLRSGTGGAGAAGDISIDTGKLIIQGGGQISTNTEGKGNGGNLTVTARKSVELIGRSNVGDTSSALLSQQSNGNGVAGNIRINTRRLIVRDGAGISVTSRDGGTGGNLFVNASESVELTGNAPAKNGEISRSGLFSQATENESSGKIDEISGKTGNISLSTGKLIVRDGAIITVNDTNTTSKAQGAGSITITAPIILLDKQGQIVAETQSGNGGNITLKTSDILLLSNNSRISTNAGSKDKSGDGGNINISKPEFLVAVPMQNSDITANSFQGQGGNVTIEANGIIGLTPRSSTQTDLNNFDPATLPTNDVTAISLTGNPLLDGQVTINSPNTESSRVLIQSPLPQIVDPSQIIAQGCSAFGGSDGSKFIITGRGGLPPNPDDFLNTDVLWSDTRVTSTTAQKPLSETSANKPLAKSEVLEIVPATGWVFNGKGEVTLISSVSHPTSLGSTSKTCSKP